jgi:hypothetical protein
MARRIIGCILRNKKQVKSNQPDIIKMGNTTTTTTQVTQPTLQKTDSSKSLKKASRNTRKKTENYKYGLSDVSITGDYTTCGYNIQINGDIKIHVQCNYQIIYTLTGTGNGDDTMSNCICTYKIRNTVIECHGTMPSFSMLYFPTEGMLCGNVTKVVDVIENITMIGSFNDNYLPEGKCTIIYPDKTRITCVFSNGITFYKGKLIKYDKTILEEVDESKIDENNTDE